MARQRILLGVIGRPHGVGGLVHVQSYTSDPRALSAYDSLEDEKGEKYRLEWVADGIARLSVLSGGEARPISDRTAASRVTNRRLYVPRTALPALAEEEFYFADLIGLEAFDADGKLLGRVTAVHDYGAGASLEIGALLVPFTRAAVPEIDLKAERLVIVPPAAVEVRGEAQ
jgi:16S rRNA processing protein RimM